MKAHKCKNGLDKACCFGHYYFNLLNCFHLKKRPLLRPWRNPMKPKNMSPYDIIAAIRNRGLTSTDLSRRLSPAGDITAVSKAIRRPWPRLNVAIAEVIGLTVREVWPEWYKDDGSLIRPISGNKNNITSTKVKRLNARSN